MVRASRTLRRILTPLLALRRNLLLLPPRKLQGYGLLLQESWPLWGKKSEDGSDESLEKPDSSVDLTTEQTSLAQEGNKETVNTDLYPPAETNTAIPEELHTIALQDDEVAADPQAATVELSEPSVDHAEESDSSDHIQHRESSEVGGLEYSAPKETEPMTTVGQADGDASPPHELHDAVNLQKSPDESPMQQEVTTQEVSAVEVEEASNDSEAGSVRELDGMQSATSNVTRSTEEGHLPTVQHSDEASEMVPELVSHEENTIARSHLVNHQTSDFESDVKDSRTSLESNSSDTVDSFVELEKVRRR